MLPLEPFSGEYRPGFDQAKKCLGVLTVLIHVFTYDVLEQSDGVHLVLEEVCSLGNSVFFGA